MIIVSSYFSDLLWKAPELLREPNNAIRGTQKGDVYSFAIILFEIVGRKGPYGITMDPKGNYCNIITRQ